MRWIQKRNEPRELTEWRARYKNDTNFGYDLLRGSRDVIKTVTDSLLTEQGWLCAYTGLRIDENRCHIEHIKAQDYCTPEETVQYTNILACCPAPNPQAATSYGAEKKGNWPPPEEQYLFVSPLERTCETRFLFNLQGEISSPEGDNAAVKTICKLGLNDDELIDWRKGAIKGLLKNNSLRLSDARKRLKQLETQQDGHLEEFCFVLVQALKKHIHRLECIINARKHQ